MKEIDPINYHLSNFHRDLMESNSPTITEGYEFLHAQLKDAERAVYERKCEIREYIRTHKLKATKKPEVIERQRLRKIEIENAKTHPVKPDPVQLALPLGDVKPLSNRIAELIAGMKARP